MRIEQVAEKENIVCSSSINLESISVHLNSVGISNEISNSPTHYLCNEAYWYLLQKFKGNVILVHIPSIKNINGAFIEKMKQVFSDEENLR